MKNKFKTIFPVVALLALILGLNMVQSRLEAQVGQVFPNVYQTSTLAVGWTAGTVNNGGEPVTITASSGAVTIQQDSCAAPLFNECNIVWANSSGTVTITATSAGIATASAAGNTILAYVETSGSAITSIVYPQQASIANMAQLQAYDCGIAVACASAGAAGSLLGTSTKIAFGSAAMTTGAAAITGLPFTNSSSYGCTASLAATSSSVGVATFVGLAAVPSSGSAMTITANGSAETTPVTFICIGS